MNPNKKISLKNATSAACASAAMAAERQPMRGRKSAHRPFFTSRFQIPRHAQTMILEFPAVRHHLDFMRRVVMLEAAQAMIDSGHFSLRSAATTLGLSATALWQWQKNYAERGVDGLRTRERKRFQTRGACSLKIFLCP